MATRITAEFEDIDQFIEQLSLWGWEGSIRQTECGRFGVKLELQHAEGMTAFRTSHRTGNLREVLPPSRARTFGLVVPASNTNAWCSQSFDQVILQMMPQCDYLAANAGAHLGYQFSFSDELIHQTLDQLEIPEVLDPGAHRFELNNDQAVEIQSLLDELWSESHDGQSAALAAEAVLSVFLQSFSSVPVQPHPPRHTRSLVVSRAREFIEANLGEPLTLADIGRAAAASRRTLTQAFRDQLGISPIQYLKLTRLNRVHQNLRRSAPGTVGITDTANRYGFWHMGQFARDYRALFGELPSESLSRR